MFGRTPSDCFGNRGRPVAGAGRCPGLPGVGRAAWRLLTRQPPPRSLPPKGPPAALAPPPPRPAGLPAPPASPPRGAHVPPAGAPAVLPRRARPCEVAPIVQPAAASPRPKGRRRSRGAGVLYSSQVTVSRVKANGTFFSASPGLEIPKKKTCQETTH